MVKRLIPSFSEAALTPYFAAHSIASAICEGVYFFAVRVGAAGCAATSSTAGFVSVRVLFFFLRGFGAGLDFVRSTLRAFANQRLTLL
jgi:hypothetical protein